MGHWLSAAAQHLAQAGIDNAEREAQELLAQALKWDRCRVLTSREMLVAGKDQRRFWALIQRRAQREPLQYLLGTEFFCGNEFRVGPGVLIPRPETELLVAEALRYASADIEAIADLGTGSGILALTLAQRYPQAVVYGVDISEKALRWARLNKRRLKCANCRLLLGTADQPIPKKYVGKFALVVSNPPYIPNADLKTLQPEVLEEPRLALIGGKQGTEIIEHMLKAAARLLRFQGIFVCEIGIHQAPEVRQLFTDHGFDQVREITDWQNIPRIVSGVKSEKAI